MVQEVIVATLLALSLLLSACTTQTPAPLAEFMPPASWPEARRTSWCGRFVVREAEQACLAHVKLASR